MIPLMTTYSLRAKGKVEGRGRGGEEWGHPLISCVTLSLKMLPVFYFLYLENEDNNSNYLVGLL